MLWQTNADVRQWKLTPRAGNSFRVPIFRPCVSIPLPEIRLPCIPLLPTRAMLNIDGAARVLVQLLRIAAEEGQ